MRRCFAIYVAVLVLLAPITRNSVAAESLLPDPASVVRSILNKPERMDFGRAKLAMDTLADPSIDAQAALAEIDTMVAAIRSRLATLPPEAAATSMEKMKALRAFLYESGPWNDDRPFRYDMDDPNGQNPRTQLLPLYLASRKGNCVSMPILFVILGERLGLDVTLSTAPLHVFVKYTDDASGETYNLETTSGAGFTRDLWYRRKLPMTDEAVAKGVYLKTLTRREALAVMTTTILDNLLAAKRYEDAISVADAILEAYPAHAYALVKKGTAYQRLLKERIIEKYPRVRDIPAELIPYANELYRANQEAFAKAEAMGWRMPEIN